ncbi:unnamed protein product [Dibothriocephalus latus]|uniref:Transglutaminase-like domain-containing protein n=1 Tax=Dibothriocephalus latus TaxID=60516 RepID=A0A3P7QR27_DIBLA|nr:unnamed protein product [Dibothriocephalus latus]
MQFPNSDLKHSWNAVLVDGTWRLVDCNWAAHAEFGKGAKVGKVTYKLDTFYFLTDPIQLIYTHFPHETDWQLLHQPITSKVSTQSSLFSTGQPKCIIIVTGIANITKDFTKS